MENKPKTVVVSGGFDPIHIGHVEHFKAAKKLGDKLIVVIDGDEFLIGKKGHVFMPQEERAAIIREFKCVDQVICTDKADIADAIRELKPDIIAKGGDRTAITDFSEDEQRAIKEVGCQVLFGVGGGKIQASSNLLNSWVKRKSEGI